MSDDARIILEHFDDKFAAMLENLEIIIENKVRPIVQEELVEVKQDIKTIKIAVTDTNHELQLLEKRVSKLEAAV
jgi:hypothetical protein